MPFFRVIDAFNAAASSGKTIAKAMREAATAAEGGAESTKDMIARYGRARSLANALADIWIRARLRLHFCSLGLAKLSQQNRLNPDCRNRPIISDEVAVNSGIDEYEIA